MLTKKNMEANLTASENKLKKLVGEVEYMIFSQEKNSGHVKEEKYGSKFSSYENKLKNMLKKLNT